MVVENCLVVRDAPQPHWHWVQNCSAGETLLSQAVLTTAGSTPGLLPCFRHLLWPSQHHGGQQRHLS